MLGGAFDALVYWHWLSLAGILVGLEILAPGVFLIFPGLAAVIVGLVVAVFPALDWRFQLLLFAVLALAFIFLGRRVYGRMSTSEDHDDLNRRTQRLVGQVYPLAAAMTGGRGRLRVGDTDWLARLADDTGGDFPAGKPMRIVAVDGATLVVAPRE